MKKIKLCISALLLLGSGVLLAQGGMDAYRFSQIDVNGSARSISMGGAFGALGGDMSAMSHNPAGIGIYRSSEIQTTININSSNAESNWTGLNNNVRRTKVGFDNLSYVGYFPTANDRGIKGWNIGIAYNKIKDFNRSYRAVGRPLFSMADYVASNASNAYGKNGGIPEKDLILTNSYDPYNNRHLDGQWLSILGYESGFFGAKYNFPDVSDVYHSAFGQWKGSTWTPYSPDNTTLRVGESGSINEYNFTVATNISDFLFLGANLGITTIDYRMSSWYNEEFGSTDYLILGNTLETNGTGYSINIGAIVRPIDQLRLGVAYNSPKWYVLTDRFNAFGESYVASDKESPLMRESIPNNSFAEYNLQSPGRWIFSAAGIIGNMALVSLDYELTSYHNMLLSDRDFNRGVYQFDNDIIKQDFKVAQTLKAGAELKITPRFAIRGGFVWQQTPMEKHLINNDVVVYTAGTIPHFTTSNCANYYTAGLGYRFTPNFYMDLAYVYRIQKEKLYPFSSTSSDWYYPEFHLEPVHSEPANVSVKTTRVALTLGYKF